MQVQTTLYQNSGWLQRSFFFVKLSDESHTLNLELNKLRCYVSAAHRRKVTIFLVKCSNFIPYPMKYEIATRWKPSFLVSTRTLFSMIIDDFAWGDFFVKLTSCKFTAKLMHPKGCCNDSHFLFFSFFPIFSFNFLDLNAPTLWEALKPPLSAMFSPRVSFPFIWNKQNEALLHSSDQSGIVLK